MKFKAFRGFRSAWLKRVQRTLARAFPAAAKYMGLRFRNPNMLLHYYYLLYTAFTRALKQTVEHPAEKASFVPEAAHHVFLNVSGVFAHYVVRHQHWKARAAQILRVFVT